MPKQTYVPTETDRLTGANVRNLRRLHSETLTETVERAGLGISQATLSRIELGQRALSLRDATKLAAHWDTIPAKIIAQPVVAPPTEQEWLGNDKTGLFAVPDVKLGPGNVIVIDRDAPLSPAEYRDQVWIPYLESRYATDLKQTG